VAKHRGLELTELGPGLNPELVHEGPPRRAIRGHGVRLPSGAVEGQHQLAAQTFAEGVVGDGSFELRDERAMTPEREVGLDSQLGGVEPEIVEPGRGDACKRLVFESRERCPAPERESFAEQGRRLSRAPCLEGVASSLEEALEPVEVDLPGLESEGIAVCAGLEHPLAKLSAQARDVDLEALAGGAGRLLAPELVDQAISRDALLPVQDQEREERGRLAPAQI
jgi:hypothetical protein